MRPDQLLDETLTPEGARLSLRQEGAHLVIRLGNLSLMSSRVSGSEALLAERGCLGAGPRAVVLVGGLGMGFTLRAALDHLGPEARVVVAELLPALVGWNRGLLGPLAGHPLQDPRVALHEGDVVGCLRAAARGPESARYDRVLLDVDNGPQAFTADSNAWLYGAEGLRTTYAALRPGGLLVVWSAFPAPRFAEAMARAGFRASVEPVRARGAIKKGSRHLLYLGERA